MLVLCWLLALALAALVVAGAVNRMLDGILDSYIDVRLEGLVSRAINDAVLAQLEADSGFYTGLVQVQRDDTGAIAAIETDTVRINLLKARIAQDLLDTLEQAGNRVMTVPVGTLLGGNLLLGRGPGVSVRLMPVGAANTVVASEFSPAGINQTLHRMSLEVEVAVTIIRPGSAVTRLCSRQVVLAETVIVGQVPDSYTYIDDTRDGTLDKILDYKTP